jgi:hypothetical protein
MKLLLCFGMLLMSQVCVLAAGRPEPQAQIDTFFKDWGEKGGMAAMKELCEGTLLELQKGIQLESSAPQLDGMIKLYGKVARVENVDKRLFGQSLMRLRLISYHDTGAPLFWEFMFIRAKEEWQIYVIRFNDQFYQVFSEP